MHLTKSHFKQIVLEEYTKLLNEKKRRKGWLSTHFRARAFDYIYNLIAKRFPDQTNAENFEMVRRNIRKFIGNYRAILPDGDLSNGLLDKYLNELRGAHGSTGAQRVAANELATSYRSMPERYWRSEFGIKRLFSKMAGAEIQPNCPCVNASAHGRKPVLALLGIGLHAKSSGKTIKTKDYGALPYECVADCVEDKIQELLSHAVEPPLAPREAPPELPSRPGRIPDFPDPVPHTRKTCRETYPDRRDAPPKKYPPRCGPDERGDLTKLYACWYPSNIPGSEHRPVPDARHIRCLKHLPKRCRRVGRKGIRCTSKKSQTRPGGNIPGGEAGAPLEDL